MPHTGKLNFAVHSGSGGATFRMGAGAPADSLGADDDTYLNTTAGIFYDKDSGHLYIPLHRPAWRGWRAQ